MNKFKIVGLSALLLGAWNMGRAQMTSRAIHVMQAETGMQVVLETIPTTDGHLWVRPKSQTYFRLVPKDSEAHYAPLPPHSLMLCREFDYKDANGSTHAAFTCGTDNYLLFSFGFVKENGTEGDTERKRNLGVPAGDLR